MAKTFHVFSTLANDQRYASYTKGGGDVMIKLADVLIKGGAGVANDRLITPLGVVTTVGEDEMALLKGNGVFNDHVERGHLVVREKSADADKVAADMNRADESAPLTPADFADPKPGEATIRA